MSPRLSILTVAILAYAAVVAAQGTSPAKPQRPDQEAATPFRVSVDVVAVDVQVIDKTGRPVPDLGPEKFTVTINGRRRRVVSAERIGSEMLGEGERVIAASGKSVRGRVIVLAVDCISFDATASRGVIQAISQFVKQLSPDDFVGLSAYPNGAKLDPTTDHAAVLRALGTVVGQKDLAEMSQYHLRPSEIIDLSRELMRGGGPTVDAIVARECGNPVDPVCQSRFIQEVSNTALFYEGQAGASLGMLRTIVQEMGGFLGRKTLILVSGGMVASDVPGGRPDLGEMGIQVGKDAAIANTTIYTLYIESSFIERFSAQTRAGDKSLVNWSRDSTLMARWLEQFTGAAGGALFSVQVGNAESALARIQTELSSYYLLGVEPGDEDRDGRTHQIAVKTTQPNVTIRGRRWVTVPRRTGTAASTKPAATAPEPPPADPATTAPAPAPPPVRREIPADVQVLADAFDRGNYDVFQRALGRSSDLAATHPGVPDVGQPVAERSPAHRGLRARDGDRRPAQPERLRSRRRRPAARRVSRPRPPAKRAGCVRVCVVPDRSGRARRALPARQRHALHPPRAAALPDHSPAAPCATRSCRNSSGCVAASRRNRNSTSSGAMKRR